MFTAKVETDLTVLETLFVFESIALKLGNTTSDLRFDGDVRTTFETLEDQVTKDTKGSVADSDAVGLKASMVRVILGVYFAN